MRKRAFVGRWIAKSSLNGCRAGCVVEQVNAEKRQAVIIQLVLEKRKKGRSHKLTNVATPLCSIKVIIFFVISWHNHHFGTGHPKMFSKHTYTHFDWIVEIAIGSNETECKTFDQLQKNSFANGFCRSGCLDHQSHKKQHKANRTVVATKNRNTNSFNKKFWRQDWQPPFDLEVTVERKELIQGLDIRKVFFSK